MNHIWAGQKHPDNMTRKEKIQTLQSFEDKTEAMRWWLTFAPRLSRKAFEEATKSAA